MVKFTEMVSLVLGCLWIIIWAILTLIIFLIFKTGEILRIWVGLGKLIDLTLNFIDLMLDFFRSIFPSTVPQPE